MVIQFHLTSKCNFRCKHCYQNEYTSETISFEKYKEIIDKTKKYFNKVGNNFDSIFLTGGEPFIISDIIKYIQYASDNTHYVGMLSNGTLITPDILHQIKKIQNFGRIQVSLEGPEYINDNIRGVGSYKKICDAIKMIRREDIVCTVSCTIASYNYDKIEELYEDLAYNVKPNRLWFDRCIPFKEASAITVDQFKVFLSCINKIQKRMIDEKLFTYVSAARALQFLASNMSQYYTCGAGSKHFTIMPNGDVMICRRLENSVVGNIINESWEDIINHSKNKIDEIHKLPDSCSECKYARFCNGGLKCLTYNQLHTFNHKDINCPL